MIKTPVATFSVEVNGLNLTATRYDSPNGLNSKYSLNIPSEEESLLCAAPDTPAYYQARTGISGLKVGTLDALKIIPKDGVESTVLQMVKVSTEHVPDSLPYKNLKGMGSCLLDMFCEDLDRGDIRGYLLPQSLGDGLSTSQLIEWYKRRGFQSAKRFPLVSRINLYTMIRDRAS